MSFLILENLTTKQRYQILNIIERTHDEADVENQQRVLDQLVYDFEDAEVFILEGENNG
jgi:hypothetical protein